MCDNRLISASALRSFASQVFLRLDVPAVQAETAADVLVWSDLHGVDTHGMRNLKSMYVDPLQGGVIDPRPEFVIEHVTPISSRLNGGGGLGLVAADWAMRHVIDQARHSGACFATMHHSYHLGAAGRHALMAVEHDMIGLCMSGFFHADGAKWGLLPTFGLRPMMSTNPLSISFPTNKEHPFLLDMATSIVPYNRILMMIESGQPIPAGWGLDERGQPTTDPSFVRGLLPLGGTREQGGHKGFGLALMVQVLCGVLSGGWAADASTETVVSKGKYGQSHDAHFFGAIRIDAFRDAVQFKKDLDGLIGSVHASPPMPGKEQIFVPGEIEHRTKKGRLQDGVPVPASVWAQLRTMANTYDVPLPK